VFLWFELSRTFYGCPTIRLTGAADAASESSRFSPIILLFSADADDIMAGIVLKKQEKRFTP